MNADESDAELDAATEERVRALLAEARVEEPAPREVVDRLDAVLAALRPEDGPEVAGPAQEEPAQEEPAQEEPAQEAAGTVLGFRRRVLPKLLVAAAAVVVAGVAVTGITRGTGDGAGGSQAEAGDSSASQRDPQDRTRAEAETDGLPSAAVPSAARSGAPSAADDSLARSTPPQSLAGRALTTSGFAAELTEVARARADGAGESSPGAPPALDPMPRTAEALPPTACTPPRAASGFTETVTLDDAPATLVVEAAVDGRQRVTAYGCDGETELASAVLRVQ